MTHLTIASLLLAAAVNAAPEAPAAPAPAAKAAPVAEKAATPAASEGPAKPAPAAKAAKPAKPAKPVKASKAAIKDAIGSLLGPCSPEMAGATLKAVSVIDGVAMNEIIEKEKSAQAKADPAALFMVVEYAAGAETGKDYRQISTSHHLTTEQAQVLVGEKMCVFGKAP